MKAYTVGFVTPITGTIAVDTVQLNRALVESIQCAPPEPPPPPPPNRAARRRLRKMK